MKITTTTKEALRCHEQWKKRTTAKTNKQTKRGKEITTDTHNIKFNIKLYINTDDGKRKNTGRKGEKKTKKKNQEKAENI